MSENPFEKYDLDPLEGAAALTEALRERIEEAETEDVRREIRAAWEALTMHPRRRVELALAAHPETRPRIGAPPRPTHGTALPEPEVLDIVTLPPVAAALGASPAQAEPALPDDPFLRDP